MMILTVLTLSAQASLLDLPPGEHHTFIASASEPMHWFEGGYFYADTSTCRVGVPVSGDGELVMDCASPGALRETVPPAAPELMAPYLRVMDALEAVPDASQAYAVYLGTWVDVEVVDVIVDVPGRTLFIGRAHYAVKGDQIERSDLYPPMTMVSGYTSSPRVASPSWLNVSLPDALAERGEPVLGTPEPSNASWVAFEQAVREAVLSELPSYLAGKRRQPSP